MSDPQSDTSQLDPSNPPNAYGQPISAERQAGLQGHLDRWAAETDHGERKGPFDQGSGPATGVPLTGADVSWLEEQVRTDADTVPDLHLERASLASAHLEGASLDGAHLERANLNGAHLEGASLRGAQLERAGLNGAHLEGAALNGAHLEGANLTDAQLEGATLSGAHLEGANLTDAHLEGAYLIDTHLERASLASAHLERATLDGAHLEGASLDGAHLEGASLSDAHLEGAYLIDTHLEGAYLASAQLEGAILRDAQLEGATLSGAHLEGARLDGAHLEGAYLGGAHLERANLTDAHLERAYLRDAHLEGANLTDAHLEGASLTRTWLDSKTVLSDAHLDDKTKLGDIHWNGVGAVDLTSATWVNVPTLGDEDGVGIRSSAQDHEGVVRAYRQVAAQLRAQGMNEVADRFLYRAQVRQRGVLLRRFRLPQYLGSWILAILAGYGYRPGRTIVIYLLAIVGFALAYLQFGIVDGHPFNLVEAAVFSVTSFHGRGFFPGGLKLDDPVTVMAAGEAVLGLFIEISFIATFTQRFFGAK